MNAPTKFPTMPNGARYLEMNPRPTVNASTNHATDTAAAIAQMVQPSVLCTGEGFVVTLPT